MTQERVIELFSPYVEEFKGCIEYHANVYKLMGSSLDESPMWFQYRGKKDGKLMFVNSQKSQIGFSIALKENQDIILIGITDMVYDFFRDVKYSYLKENHPTVYSQIKSL